MIGINSLITFIFPSRSRPEKFFAALDNISEMVVSDNYEIICSLDEDDATMNNRDVEALLKEYNKVRAFYGKSYGKISAINRDLQKINYQTKIIICFSDDQEFTMKGFDVQIRNDMVRYFPDTDGMLHYPDSTPNELRIMSMSVIGIEYFKRNGYIYNPIYHTWFPDDEEICKARILGKYKFVNTRLYVHKHYLFGNGEPDDLNKKNDNMELVAKDRTTFMKRKEINFGL